MSEVESLCSQCSALASRVAIQDRIVEKLVMMVDTHEQTIHALSDQVSLLA